MNAHYDLDEIDCPECGGMGYEEVYLDDVVYLEECFNCHGAGKVQVKIRKLDVEEE